MPLAHRFSVSTVLEEGRTTKEDIEELRRWLSTQNYPKLTDQQIVLFLLSCDNHQSFTRKTVGEHYKAKINGPEIFNNRYVDLEEVHKQINVLYYAIFPKRTADGCVVAYHKLRDTLYSNYCMEPAIKMFLMVFDLAIQGCPPTGLIMIFDMDGVGFRHLSRIRLGAFRKLAHYVQEGLILKLKAIHVMNTYHLIDKILFILKPFIKKELLEMLHLHPISCNMEEFYEKHVPADCLPIEYGGSLPSIDALHEETVKQVRELEPYFEAEENQRKEVYKS